MTDQSQAIAERGLGSKVITGHIVINDNPDAALLEKARWYVVHTYSGHEARVAETLRHLRSN
jgi:hypothetical protein